MSRLSSNYSVTLCPGGGQRWGGAREPPSARLALQMGQVVLSCRVENRHDQHLGQKHKQNVQLSIHKHLL